MTTETAPRKPRAKRKPTVPDVQIEAPVQATECADLTTAQRTSMIAEAAYFRAQQRGFAQGHELADWLAAEAEIGLLNSH